MYEARQIEGQLHLNERVRRHTAEKPSWNRTEAGAAKANPTQKAKRFFFAVGEASWPRGRAEWGPRIGLFVNQGAVRSASSPHGRGEAGPATTSTSHPTARRLALANYAQACACATRLTPHPLAPPADRRRRLRRTFAPAFRDGERELYYTSEIYQLGWARMRERGLRGGEAAYTYHPSMKEGPLLCGRCCCGGGCA